MNTAVSNIAPKDTTEKKLFNPKKKEIMRAQARKRWPVCVRIPPTKEYKVKNALSYDSNILLDYECNKCDSPGLVFMYRKV